jgi:tetratricopeptide (TPR) repeat protein
MLEDAQGLEVTTDSKETIAAINCFIKQSLSYGKDIEVVINQGMAADPTCALIHGYAAAYYLCQENALASQQAKPHLQVAQQNLSQVTKRERWYIQAITAWATGAMERAVALHEAIAQEFPSDLISVQQGQYHYFYLGDQERLLKIAQKVFSANQENSYLYGMLAFGLEQCHQLMEAETMARVATMINRYDPWAHHAIAHVMETQGRVDEGIVWMESYADTWEDCNSMLYTHNWWHIALYYLKKGDEEKVLELYDTRVWGRAQKESPKDQVGAIALLLRLELRGVDVGIRWQQLSVYLVSRLYEHALPFHDLHYVYALARAGHTEWLAQMEQSMLQHVATLHPYLRQNWCAVAIPAAKGMVAHAQGNWLRAIAQLKPVLPLLHKIGGSHAQRVLFEQVYRDAVLQSEKPIKVFCTGMSK